MAAPPETYRAPMRSRLDEVDPALAVERALTSGLVGMGGRLPRAPVSRSDALRLMDTTYDERTARRLERFMDVPAGSHVWTRDPDGALRRGVVDGPWSYDGSGEAVAADLVHVRACTWDDEVLAEHQAPAAVVAAFRRGGRNFQAIGALRPGRGAPDRRRAAGRRRS